MSQCEASTLNLLSLPRHFIERMVRLLVNNRMFIYRLYEIDQTPKNCLCDILSLRSTCRVLCEITNTAMLKIPCDFTLGCEDVEVKQSNHAHFLEFMQNETNWKFCFVNSSFVYLQCFRDLQSLMSKYENLFVGSVKKVVLIAYQWGVEEAESFLKLLKIKDTEATLKFTIDFDERAFSFAPIVDDLELLMRNAQPITSLTFVPFVSDILINYSNLSTLNAEILFPIGQLLILPTTLRKLVVTVLDVRDEQSQGQRQPGF